MATPRSANDWPVLTTPPPAHTIPGTAIRLRIRGGDVATVLLYVAARFHAEVESLTLPVKEVPGYDDWGYAYRPVRGQSSGFSNHASGTAVDLNATQHPRGVKGTFSAAERAKVRKILASTKDKNTGREVVRWGEDYSGTVDGMHFEINADAAAVGRVARRIREKQAQPDTAPRDPLEDIMATPAERAAFAKEVAAQTAALLRPEMKALTARDEDGLYVRAKGTRAIYQVISGVRVWVDLDDYEAAGRPEVQDVDAGDELLKLRLIGARPPVDAA